MPPRTPRTSHFHFLVQLVAAWLHRQQARQIALLLAENRVLRARLGSRRFRLTDSERRLLAEKARGLSRAALQGLASLASPETLLRWYRDLVAAKYDGSSRRGPGRPPKRGEASRLLLAMARENPSWGYTRLRGALANVGFQLGRATIARILGEHGLEPAPRRGRSLSWRTFLAAHSGAIAAADFFTAEVLTMRGLVRYLVFFAIDLKSRRVKIAGISPSADGAWLVQMARNLTDPVDGALLGIRKLIVDRDPLYTAHFAETLRTGGVELVRLPPSSPNLNAHAERFVRSIKSECLAKVIPLGEEHLRTLVREYVEHYHEERNHQGLGNVIPFPRAGAPPPPGGAIKKRERLGGLLSFYHRDAA